MSVDVREISQAVAEESALLQAVRREIGKAIVGQQTMIDRLLVALLCNNHVLIEGVPGTVAGVTGPKTGELGPSPSPLAALMVKVRAVPLLKPLMTVGLAEVVTVCPPGLMVIV